VKKRIAFLTVVYPGVESYLDDFFNSLSDQTNLDFDLVIVDDGIDLSLGSLKNVQIQNVSILKGVNNPAKNREIGINHIIENDYDFLIFGDADDYFANNRIETSLRKLSQYNIVVNDLNIVDNDKHSIQQSYYSKRLFNNQIIDFDFIKTKNIFGLSNTAVNVSVLKNLSLNESIVAVDWYLFSILLSRNNTAVFTNETTTYYRQHASNTVGISEITEKKLRRILEIKQGHYQLMLETDTGFESNYRATKRIQKRFDADRQFVIECINGLKSTNIPYFWWEEITTLENEYKD